MLKNRTHSKLQFTINNNEMYKTFEWKLKFKPQINIS